MTFKEVWRAGVWARGEWLRSELHRHLCWLTPGRPLGLILIDDDIWPLAYPSILTNFGVLRRAEIAIVDPAEDTMSLLLSAAMAEFDRYLMVERNLSPSTRDAYKFDLQKFKEHMIRTKGQEPTVNKVGTDSIKEYLHYLQSQRGYKSTTLSRVIASIRVLFEYCTMQKYIDSSPATYIHNPKLPRKLPIYLIDSELKKLLSAPDSRDMGGRRDFAILVTLGFTGMRRQELVGLNLNSIDLERRTIRVFGKGSKERLIPMNDFVFNALNNYLEVRPVTGDPEAIFLNRNGGRLTGRSIVNIVRKYVRLAGIGKEKISPHKLRHTFATLLHMNEVDILEIKSLLGHASITSTQIYTHTNSNKLRNAVDRLNHFATPDSV